MKELHRAPAKFRLARHTLNRPGDKAFQDGDEPLVPDREGSRAERAVDQDHPIVIAHGVAFVRREPADDRAVVLFGTAAATRNLGAGLDAHFLFFMEQPPDKLLEREFRITAEPAVYYVTPHYKDYDSVLARVEELSEAALRELLESGHEYVTAKAKRPAAKRGRPG